MTLTKQDLLYGKSTAPGRQRSYEANIQAGNDDLLPYSCKLRVYNNALTTEMQRTSKDLRWGAGVKLILDLYENPEPLVGAAWGFYLDPAHPDYDKLTEHQKQFLVSESELDESYVIQVADAMDTQPNDSELTIEFSWWVFSERLWWMSDLAAPFQDTFAKVVVDLTALRPHGTSNGRGLTATGPVGDGTESSNTASFLAIYEHLFNYLTSPSIDNFLILFGVLNGTIRRGGLYKNGIITSSMHYSSQHVEDYLNVPLVNIPGSHKKGVSVDAGVLDNKELTALILDKVRNESVFLTKQPFADLSNPDAAYFNVCVGLGVPHDGTCLIWRVNFGMCNTLQDIVEAYKETTEQLTRRHFEWRERHPEKAAYSASVDVDRQIGVDVMGLANFLAIHNITYKEFIAGAKQFLEEFTNDSFYPDFSSLLSGPITAYSLAATIVYGQFESMRLADVLCEEYGAPPFLRMFCVEPAQSHGYETYDAKGFTTCRGIWPPLGRRVNFSTETRESRTVRHGKVETVKTVSEEDYEQVHEVYQELLDTSGRAHAISYDLRREPTEEWFRHFILDSPLKTKYYTEIASTNQEYLSKEIKEVKN